MVLLAARVQVAQLGHDLDRIEPGVLGQCVRDDLQRLGKRANAPLVQAGQRLGPSAQLETELHLGRAPARDQRPLLHQAPDDAQRVVQGPLRLLQHQLVAPAEQHARRVSRVGHTRDFHHLALAHARRLDEGRRAELLRLHVVDVRDRQTPQRLADVLDLLPLDVLHHHDLRLGQVVQRQVGDRVPKDRLLDQQHVAPRRLDLLDDPQDIVPLLLQDPIHGRVVVHHHVGLQVGLWRADLELNQRDLGVLHPGRAARRLARPLVQHQPLDHLRVVDRPALPAHHLDILQVDHPRRLVCNLQQAIDRHGRQQIRVLRHHLGRQRRRRRLQEALPIVHAHRHRKLLLQKLDGILARLIERVRDHRRMYPLLQQLERLFQQRPTYDHHRRRPVPGHHVLRLGQFHQHLRRRLLHLHLVQNRRPVVRDDHLARLGPRHHLVHPARTERRPNGVRDRLGRLDVQDPNVPLVRVRRHPHVVGGVLCHCRCRWRCHRDACTMNDER